MEYSELPGIGKKIDFDQRLKIIDDSNLSLHSIREWFIERGIEENIEPFQAKKLMKYLNSFDMFLELEGLHFYHYDPNDTVIWNDILDHVYVRSVTGLEFLN